MTALITLDQAKRQVQKTEYTDDDLTLYEMMQDATDIVIDYIKQPNHGWDETTVPGQVRRAILLVLANLDAHRGDDQASDPLSEPVKALLARERDPALA